MFLFSLWYGLNDDDVVDYIFDKDFDVNNLLSDNRSFIDKKDKNQDSFSITNFSTHTTINYIVNFHCIIKNELLILYECLSSKLLSIIIVNYNNSLLF